ncbi:MAG: SDR family NAD(P)-dependent oxidoreductase [Alphaproteobacteria bacterium]|nr:SDR family NAD(P)-dependent oxidoreductase [Alphaproteobacteria bacterium]MBE8219728.1 SDR family NAD(P)-dependent oxidoreductase [Alphaproteobacteria bacterium]
MPYYKNKTCIITGAASGIGRACALRLAEEGAYVVLCDIRNDMLTTALEDIKQSGGKGETHIVDVADRDAVFALADDIEARLGGADLILNNAGVAQVTAVADLSLDDFEWMMNINFWGVVHGTQAFLPQMQRRQSGYIANVSSIFGLFSVPRQAAYNASKFAVLGFTDALRHEMALAQKETGANIGVSCIHPGGINTNIVRHARWAQSPDAQTEHVKAIDQFSQFTMTQPDKAAKIILKGIAKRKARILIGPDAVYVDIVRRLFPSRYLRLMPFLTNND